MRRYTAPLMRFFDRKLEGPIEDLVQDTLLACIKGRHDFRREGGVRSYVFGIARHVLFAALRAKHRAAAVVQQLPSVGKVLACGTHGEQVVFTVVRSSETLDQRSFEIIAVAGEPAALAWRVELGRWEPSPFAQNRDNAGPEAAPNRGPISDFVPFVLHTYGVGERSTARRGVSLQRSTSGTRPRSRSTQWTGVCGSSRWTGIA